MKKILLVILFLFILFNSLCFGLTVDFDSTIEYTITFDPSTDERVISHYLYITNLNTNNIQKIDLEDQIVYTFLANTLIQIYKYKLTVTAYGYIDEDDESNNILSESDHCDPLYFQNIAPIITSFSLSSSSDSFTVSIISLNVTDNMLVTGYYKSEINTLPVSPAWLSIKPTNHTFSSSGNQTLYMWARDEVGNVSLRSSATTFITTPTCANTPSLCLDETECNNAGWNWCGSSLGCQEEICPPTITSIISNGVIFKTYIGD